jgi:peroxiredoxin family protein
MSRRLSIVVVSGTHERLQMAAMLTSVGAVTGNDVRVFLSMNALPLFRTGAPSVAPAEGEVGELLARKNVPPFKQLFENAVELGAAQLLPCSMAMDLLGYEPTDLEPYISPPIGLTKFLADAEEGQLLSF